MPDIFNYNPQYNRPRLDDVEIIGAAQSERTATGAGTLPTYQSDIERTLVSYHVDWGDGDSEEGPFPNGDRLTLRHTYYGSETPTVRLTITDATGATTVSGPYLGTIIAPLACHPVELWSGDLYCSTFAQLNSFEYGEAFDSANYQFVTDGDGNRKFARVLNRFQLYSWEVYRQMADGTLKMCGRGLGAHGAGSNFCRVRDDVQTNSDTRKDTMWEMLSIKTMDWDICRAGDQVSVVVTKIFGEDSKVYFKRSKDGRTWPPDADAPLIFSSHERCGAWVRQLRNGTLLISDGVDRLYECRGWGMDADDWTPVEVVRPS